MNKEKLIKKFNMEPHPEGGYFVETFKSDINFLGSNQTLYSSILFLLGKNDISHLHVLKEDELWYYQGGDSCIIVDIDENFNIKTIKLGLKDNEFPQYLVKKGHIFGSKYIGESFTLVGCMVSPSFMYEHFELITKNYLKNNLNYNDFIKIEDMLIE